jgi:sigma-E factor negative regulatory protein RseB
VIKLKFLTFLKGVALASFLIQPIASLASEKQSAGQILEKMLAASRTVNYSGLVTYEKAARIKTVEILHLVNEGFSFRKINHLDGPKGEYSKLLPVDNCASLIPYGDYPIASSILNKESMEQIKKSYYFDLTRASENIPVRVAGRDAAVVLIRPRDEHRLPLRLSIDTESGIVLKTELFNLEGKALERFQFIKLAVGGDLDLLQIPLDGLPNEFNCDSLVNRAVSDAWRFRWMPSNFLIRKAERLAPARQDTFVFSDGLAVVTVIIESPKLSSKLPELKLNYGGASIVSLKHIFDGKVFNVSVVGEIPLPTAIKIANGVTYSSKAT